MEVNTIGVIILLVSFFFMVFIGVKIAYSMIASAILSMIYLELPIMTVFQSMIDGVDGFAFLSIPFFILAGEIMSAGGISERLIGLANAMVGWMRGGLAMVNIVASMFFGGISGSASADTASLGSILIPMMKKNGYDSDFATTVTMASSVQGLLVPPSHNMVIFALAAGGVSVGKLFLGGIIPGIFLGLALMVFSYIVSLKRGYPVGDKFSIKALIKEFMNAILGVMTVLIVVFGVVTGRFTATESAAIAVIYAFVVTFFIYREIPVKAFGGVLKNAIKTLSTVMILIAAAGAFGFVIAFLKVPTLLSSLILGFTDNKYLILFLINILLLLLGTMMGMASIIVIMTPILLPIIVSLGLDPVYFGVVMILNCGIGLITPPVGGVLFIGSSISKLPIEKLAKSMLPFYAVMLAVLFAITYIPEITLFLPNLIMK